MAAKHTPSPWTWGDDYRGLYGSGEDNAILEHAYYEGMWLHHRESREADARLIEAAPDLLEAVRLCLLCLSGEHDTDSAHQHAMTVALAAIGKATGAAHD